MSRDEIEKLKSNCEKIINLTESLLNNKFYDFKNDGLNEIFLNLLLKQFAEKVQEQEDKQELVLCDAKKYVRSRYSNCYIIDYKIVNYENYYLVKIFGSPFEKVERVYSKNGDLLTCISKFDGCIDVVDNENFFSFEKNANVAVHHRFDYNGTKWKWEDINHLSNVYSNILPVFGKCLDVEYGNLVGWTSLKNDDIDLEKRVLYNYKKCCIVVPEYTDAKYDYGRLDFIEDGAGFIRIINLLSYNNHVCKLEFLINEDGELCTNVFDFDREIFYYVNQDGRSQSDILNSIYERAMNNLVDESKKNYSKVRKQ